MTDQTTTPEPNDNPFRSLGSGGLIAALVAGAGLLWAMFTGRLNKADARESEREQAAREQLELLRKMRGVEREEERHRADLREMDERIRTQLDCQELAKVERLSKEAARRASEAEEAYWNAKLAPAKLTGKDALALAKAHFETHVLEGTAKDAGYAFAQFIEELGRKLEGS